MNGDTSQCHRFGNLHVLLFAASLLFAAAGLSLAEDWPCWRGPTGLGFSRQKDLPIRWGGAEAESVLWKSPLVGEGHASPIVWGDRVFVCTARWDKSVADRAKVIPEHHVLCYRATVRRIAAGIVGMNLRYAIADSQGSMPYANVGQWFGVSQESTWQTYAWHATNACFSKMWGYDFVISPEQSIPFAIGKIEVNTMPFE